MRWTFAPISQSGPNSNLDTKVETLDHQNWQVWGAYPSLPNNPSGNTNNIGKYGLDLGTIARSSHGVQQSDEFW